MRGHYGRVLDEVRQKNDDREASVRLYVDTSAHPCFLWKKAPTGENLVFNVVREIAATETVRQR